ncbi:hypothetical protein VD659_00425 [Herbiconiux sp. 11R-BC]|uniref:hypothetical protein n=1 Tax=Herbiconiux sp. 11R-BC TaxID=3111637 RepID=UPI003C021474
MTAATNDVSTMIRWRQAEDGFWVGSQNGCFAGTIDQSGTHVYARDQFGSYIGDFIDLARAQSALAERLVVAASSGPARVAVA